MVYTATCKAHTLIWIILRCDSSAEYVHSIYLLQNISNSTNCFGKFPSDIKLEILLAIILIQATFSCLELKARQDASVKDLADLVR